MSETRALREVHGRTPRLAVIDTPIPLSRATPAEFAAEVQAVAESSFVSAMLQAWGGGLLVLNTHRQVVAANLRGFVANPDAAARSVLGLRPGEALGCVHASEERGGCGASEACRTCGALRSVLGCQESRAPVEGECVVTTGDGTPETFELHLRASPASVDGRLFTVLVLRDVSAEKRRAILERVFFHDLLNTVAGLSNSSHLLLRAPAERLRSIAERVTRQVRQLEEEVLSQRTVLEAERGTLELAPRPVSAREVLSDLVTFYADHPLGHLHRLECPEAPDLEIRTDPSLLMRVLKNMVTNALEATSEGQAVQVSCRAEEPGSRFACAFRVRNPGVMPREVALHVFERSFSTKAALGRGLGTYSMKLLGERYLGGEVRFLSEEGEGTLFTVLLPHLLAREEKRISPRQPFS